MKTIYYNGDFITLENTNPEAILIDNGIIKKVGTKEDVFTYKDNKTQLINLEGKTIMPSFIDAHSHFSGVANNLSKISLEDCNNFKEMQEKLIDYKSKNIISDNKWIVVSSYDHNNLVEKRHPTKKVLDEILPNNPVVLQHKSGHMGVFNSKALDLLNIHDNKQAIETGYMEENDFLYYLKKVPMPNINELLENYKKAQDKYLHYGITTIQDGMSYTSMIPIYKELINKNDLKLDLVCYIETSNKDIFFNSFKNSIKKYDNNFKIGGYKIFLDGSPQAKTAWMRTPYLNSNNYFGYGTMSDEQVINTIQISKNTNMQLLAHCNGDKASEQFIHCIKKCKDEIKKIRPVMIHAQLLGLDQIDDVKKYNIIPSFFISHVFYWGDIHIENFGYERASTISPANSALKHNVLFTFHQDSPVIEPNMFETIWCAVTRKTRSGVILGNTERINVIDAIKAVTINSAYQYFEENEKGSIKEGKFANLIIINKNPLKINVDEIKNIKILETIKNGITLYKAT